MAMIDHAHNMSRPHGLHFPTKRSYELEHLDKGDYTADEYEGCIVELQKINRWLGDAHALKVSLLKEIRDAKLEKFSVLDVGAGSGELLRVIAESSLHQSASLVGLELNARSAQEISSNDSSKNIHALRGDAFQLPFANAAFDYTMCSLFTHHFTDDNVVIILQELARVARRKIFVIDLHRHPIAYYFYTTIGRLFFHNRLIREDGALSILRSFKPDELLALGERAGLKQVNIRRAFPYRLILSAAAT
jgi:SAM-dependent methyltransferase